MTEIDKSKLLRFPGLDSSTTEAYYDDTYIYLFSKDDGHLAWKFNRRTNKTEFECECIKKGKMIFSLLWR